MNAARQRLHRGLTHPRDDRRVRCLRFIAAFALASCTPGASAAGSATAVPAAVTIDVSLTAFPPAATAYGQGAGFAPEVTSVSAGTTIRFANMDSFAHTATSLRGAAFPASSPFDSSALGAFGATLSGGWSSGALGAGDASQIVLADAPGTYLYGCFFHYTAPMRGAIVVR